MSDKLLNDVFKQDLINFIKSKFHSCKSFLNQIESCETDDALYQLLIDNGDDIANQLGVDVVDDWAYCDDCIEKDNEIDDLMSEIDGHNKLETLNDVYKYEAFLKHKDNFSVSQFESLMEICKLVK